MQIEDQELSFDRNIFFKQASHLFMNRSKIIWAASNSLILGMEVGIFYSILQGFQSLL